MKHSKRKSKEDGFTLVELLVVMVILGLLVGIVGPRVINYLSGAKTDTSRLQIAQMGAALDLYMIDVGRYPGQSEGLEALVAEPSGVDFWNGPYLSSDTVPLDPWGNEYGYNIPGNTKPFDLFSLGADGTEGGEGENSDIYN
jgi:general secretion pathway protein G